MEIKDSTMRRIKNIVERRDDFIKDSQLNNKDNENDSNNNTFTREEAQLIVADALNNPSYKSLAVALIIETGLRIGELVALTLDDININEGLINVDKFEDSTTHELRDCMRGTSLRKVLLSDEAKLVAKAIIDFRNKDSSAIPFLFLNSNSTGRLNTRTIDHYLRKHIHECVLGYDHTKEARTMRSLRITYATLGYLKGVDLYYLQNQLGSKNIHNYIIERNAINSSIR